MMLALELHPLCTLFPRLAGAEFDALKADIVANGQREAITVHEGLVLDGGNRYRACIEAGVEPQTTPFTGTDPVAFVLSANLHRRHLTPGQQAAIVASAQDWATAQSVGRPEKSGNVAGLNTVADRAGQSGASERTQRMADKVAKENPELAKQVAHGEISLPKALEQLAPRAPVVAKPAPAVAVEAAEAAQALIAPPGAVRPTPMQQVHEQLAADDVADASAALGAADEEHEHQVDDDGHQQLLDDYNAMKQERDALQAKVAELEAHVELLTRDDLAAQVDGLVQRADAAELKFDQLAGRNRHLQQSARDAQTTAKYQADLLARIRLALGVESNAEVLAAITTRRAA